MTHVTPETVLHSARTCASWWSLAIMAVVLSCPALAAAQSPDKRVFAGIYLGAEVGRVNVIGGSQVDGVDTLSQDTRRAVTVLGGGRYEFASRLVLGAEFGVGFEDGDLRLDDPARGLAVDYRNDRHVRYGGLLGVAVGPSRRTLVFGYLSELSRSFDVTIVEDGATMSQQDDQGLLRYGAGVERAIGRWLSVRGTAGSSRADFGARRTNITVTRPLEVAVGLLVRF